MLLANGGRWRLVTLLDRIYMIFRILVSLSTFPEESLKTKSLCEKESGIGATLCNRGRDRITARAALGEEFPTRTLSVCAAGS